MNNYFLIKYKDEKEQTRTFITKEPDIITTKHLCKELKEELQKRGVKYPIFAIDQIDEKQFRYFKMVKGYYATGEE